MMMGNHKAYKAVSGCSELRPVYANRKSFYGKAVVIHDGDDLYLKSYDTVVCGIVCGVFCRYWNSYSATTMRHINEFRRQNGMTAIGKRDWVALPIC